MVDKGGEMRKKMLDTYKVKSKLGGGARSWGKERMCYCLMGAQLQFGVI
jgi:hypothetical protein